jgi:hypothetical protein
VEFRGSVDVGAHGAAAVVDVEGERHRGPGRVDGGDLAAPVAQEAVGRTVAIEILAHDLTAIVDAEWLRLHGPGDVDPPEATPVEHETVLEELGGRVARLGVGPDHLSARARLPDDGSLGAWEVDLPEAALASQEAVDLPPGIAVGAHDPAAVAGAGDRRDRRPRRVDGGEAAGVSHEAMPVVGTGVEVAGARWPLSLCPRAVREAEHAVGPEGKRAVGPKHLG